jgi:hypothetical protein
VFFFVTIAYSTESLQFTFALTETKLPLLVAVISIVPDDDLAIINVARNEKSFAFQETDNGFDVPFAVKLMIKTSVTIKGVLTYLSHEVETNKAIIFNPYRTFITNGQTP